MRITKLLQTGLFAVTMSTGACEKAATGIVRHDAGAVRDAAAMIGADVGTVYKRPVRSAHEIAVDECLDKLELEKAKSTAKRTNLDRAKSLAERMRDEEHEAFMDWFGCDRERYCKEIDYKQPGCIAFMPIEQVFKLKWQKGTHRHK